MPDTMHDRIAGSEPLTPPPTKSSAGLRGDVRLSLHNAAKLGVSLVATWAVALGVRIYLPRHLGPAAFGAFQFADSFTTTALIITNLGLEIYIRKEVSTRASHATEFFGGTLIIRIVLSAIVLAGSVWALLAAGKPVAVVQLVFILGVAQVLFNLNGVFAALLQAAGSVDGLSVLNVVSKLLWGGGIVVAFAMGGGVAAVGVAMLLSEAVRTGGLAVLTRRRVGLRVEFNRAATVAVLIAALPFFIGTVAQSVYARIDVTIMSFLTTDSEVGWYGAASNIAGISLLVSPLIGWILLPLMARAAARSADESMFVSRRAMEFVLVLAFPITMVLYLAADWIVPTMFGAPFLPAIASLRILAPSFVLTYATIVAANLLIQMGRSWELTAICLIGMILNPLLNLLLVRRSLAHFGAGGAGIGASIAQVITEALAVAMMMTLLKGRGFDRRSALVALKTLVVCGAVALMDIGLHRIGLWRLAVDGVVYVGVLVAWRGIDVAELKKLVRIGLERRRSGAAGAAA